MNGETEMTTEEMYGTFSREQMEEIKQLLPSIRRRPPAVHAEGDGGLLRQEPVIPISRPVRLCTRFPRLLISYYRGI